jgi:hypothetical protein
MRCLSIVTPGTSCCNAANPAPATASAVPTRRSTFAKGRCGAFTVAVTAAGIAASAFCLAVDDSAFVTGSVIGILPDNQNHPTPRRRKEATMKMDRLAVIKRLVVTRLWFLTKSAGGRQSVNGLHHRLILHPADRSQCDP